MTVREGLTPNQTRALDVLRTRGSCTVRDVARKANLMPGSADSVIKALVRYGLVRRDGVGPHGGAAYTTSGATPAQDTQREDTQGEPRKGFQVLLDRGEYEMLRRDLEAALEEIWDLRSVLAVEAVTVGRIVNLLPVSGGARREAGTCVRAMRALASGDRQLYRYRYPLGVRLSAFKEAGCSPTFSRREWSLRAHLERSENRGDAYDADAVDPQVAG